MCFGDFNEVIYDFEKAGVRPGNQREITSFRDVYEFCNLNDMRAGGIQMTWNNGRKEEQNVKKTTG